MRNHVIQSLLSTAALVAVVLVCGGPTHAVEPAPACAAVTPVPNPWTKRSPPGWWMKRHGEILAAPRREEARIAFIGDSITDSWDAEGRGWPSGSGTSGRWRRSISARTATARSMRCGGSATANWTA